MVIQIQEEVLVIIQTREEILAAAVVEVEEVEGFVSSLLLLMAPILSLMWWC
jgi:hypothetical protein